MWPATSEQRRGLLLWAMLAAATLLAASHEGYLPRLLSLFGVAVLASLAIGAWLALKIPARQFAALLLVIFIVEYIKETIGVQSGMWTYHGTSGQYTFGVLAWVLGGLCAYALATRLLIPRLRAVRLAAPRWVNPLVVLALTAAIPLTLGRYWDGAGLRYFALYSALAVVAVALSLRVEFPALAGLILASWVIGNPSEYLGSVSSGCWSFTHDPRYPPLFLLLGCWPLEILSQYALSTYVAGEALGAVPSRSEEDGPCSR